MTENTYFSGKGYSDSRKLRIKYELDQQTSRN